MSVDMVREVDKTQKLLLNTDTVSWLQVQKHLSWALGLTVESCVLTKALAAGVIN